MIVRVTGKLAKLIDVHPMAAPPLDANPYADWTCRTFEIGGGQSLMLITNTASLYTVIAPANGLEDRMQFGFGLLGYIEKALTADGFGNLFEMHILPEAEEIRLTKTSNRSLTGSMTDMAEACRYFLYEDRMTLEEISGEINATPYKVIGWAFPREQFAALV